MLKQNKQVLTLILIILGLVMVMGLLFFSPLKNMFNRQAFRQQALVEQRLKDVKNYDSALAKTDLNDCQKINNLATRNVCFENLAIKVKDLSICQNINNETDKNRCIYVIIKDKALTTKSIGSCDELINQAEINKCKSQVQASNFCQTEECFDSLRQ